MHSSASWFRSLQDMRTGLHTLVLLDVLALGHWVLSLASTCADLARHARAGTVDGLVQRIGLFSEIKKHQLSILASRNDHGTIPNAACLLVCANMFDQNQQA